MAAQTYYTISPFGASKDIVDVTILEDEFAPFAPMGLPIRVPNGVSIRGRPKTLSELLTSKADGLLRAFGDYTNVVMDSCLNAAGGGTEPGIEASESFGYRPGGGFTNHFIHGNGGVIVSKTVTLPFVPDKCVVVWEVYSTAISWMPAYVDPYAQTFRECFIQPTASFDCEIYFNSSSSFSTTVTGSGDVTNISSGFQGTDLKVQFTNNGSLPFYLGNWAVIY